MARFRAEARTWANSAAPPLDRNQTVMNLRCKAPNRPSRLLGSPYAKWMGGLNAIAAAEVAMNFALTRKGPKPIVRSCRASHHMSRWLHRIGCSAARCPDDRLVAVDRRTAAARHLICRFDNSTGVLVGGLHSPTQRKVFIFVKMRLRSFKAKEMSRLSFALLIATGLALTAYFGAAAWRLSDDSRLDVTGQISHGAR
jgi:hypothetical protein